MGIMGIAIPNDIRWQRICYTEDMADPELRDNAMPPKWQTSIAVFRYVPDAEYQVTEGRRLSYLKVTCTISSYQPKTDEVDIALGGSQLTVGEAQELERKLKSYVPCHGAILQVTVTPKEQTPLREYPYIADVQPKQRALYEQVTDTGEVLSRSLETLNVRKGGGTTESQEVLDVDKGFSASGNVQASTPVGGGGGGASVSRSGEWGTRSMGQKDRSRVETTDSTRESREVLSHTTQLTQMYTLLQAYHVGTNRVMFYITPRPHTLEEPSGFIRGPRRIDGVQDFFLVVDQLDSQELPCVSVRLDTGHLTTVDEMDFDRSKPPKTLSVAVDATPPAETDGNRVPVNSNNPLYDCFETPPQPDIDSLVADAGYVVESVVDVGVPESNRGSTPDPTVSADKRTVTLTATTTGHACYRNTLGDAANFEALQEIGHAAAGPIGWIVGMVADAAGADIVPENGDRQVGFARRSVEVRFRSEQKTKKVGERDTLLVTSRVLCCCEPEKNVPPKIVDIKASELDPRRSPFGPSIIASGEVPETAPPPQLGPPDPGPRATTRYSFSAREANELQAWVSEAMARSSSAIGDVRERPALDTEYALARVAEFTLGVPRLRRNLAKPVHDLPNVGPDAMRRLREAALPLSPAGTEPTRFALMATPPLALARALGEDVKSAVTLQVRALGLGALPRPGGAPRPAAQASKKRSGRNATPGPRRK